ncbi:TRAFAC clade GTPase domain-containing protein [Phytohabitans flavus]|uniref:TRAFAC clade GTPase domain-containing protein n=1 Tax=Phytohabitans flavus TaxID=1076124 RepID=UPI0015671975|nr:hypothetical protein [Phytohabitans flavus]
MDIVMLGHSAAGKTTYVSLMYAIMNAGVEEFALRAVDDDHHASLVRAATDVVNGLYPRPSDHRDVFELVLRYRDTDIFPFTWRDYRGGTLREHSNSAQAAQLHSDLRDAGGIVLFCDSYQLVHDAGAKRDVRVLVSHVQRAMDARGEQLTPLVIVLTKADLVDLDDDKTVDLLRGPFEPLIAAVANTRHILGTIIPIACGRQLVNVTVPVLWMLRYGIVGEAARLQKVIEQSVAAAQNAAAKDTLWDRISSPFKGEPTWNQVAESHRHTARTQYQRLEPLVAPANELGSLLEGVPMF